MKISKYITLSVFVASSLFALPQEGQLIIPENNQVQTQDNIVLPQKNINRNNKNSSEDIIQVLDEANKKRLEFEQMKNQQKEKEKANDKDYVLEEMKKENEIYEETIKKRANDEKMLIKNKDIKDLDKSKTEQYHDSLKTKISTLEDMERDFSNEIKVDGIFSLKIFGDSKKIIVPTIGLNDAIEKLMIQKKDKDAVRNQIAFYKGALKSSNVEYLKELKLYEPLYTKTEFSSLKTNFIDSSRSEFSEGDVVYNNIYIKNISKNSYTLIIK